ncbi:D-erythritol 1-phosphate dehydrogenase [Vibrio stylophorae]|uniref:Glycerol-3-phosphate dehydrogenase n=1 Tax=Vibrio stylophorae TaxID=659351 RepID=A0ABM8ZPQ7_9VIBR|nr:glycerol-3-phosphate dehydrogenase [Vibrio stylophorae]CAH0532294.1 D-erythritol 1-phosphate dehydrogenase [Vibrio stylophorae]
MTQQRISVDIAIIGGGINGAGIAADAARRGLRVALFEAKDFAGATSSASSKLAHGGLRYLEQYQFRLVREALKERETLLHIAPHLVSPRRFCLPYVPQMRPAWLIRLGLFLYDHLARRQHLPSSTKAPCRNDGLRGEVPFCFEYTDCWMDDARLVLANMLAAQQCGAYVHNYCPVTHAEVQEGHWQLSLADNRFGLQQCQAKVLINAAGPWAAKLYQNVLPMTLGETPQPLRLVQGSHIVVPKLYDGEHAYILQNPDHRVVFVIPYLKDYALVGTTDCDFEGDPYQCQMQPQEQAYLLATLQRHFQCDYDSESVIASFSGVRPLCDDDKGMAQSASRDYQIKLQRHQGAPILSVFGGKLTTYRHLAEKVVDQLDSFVSLLRPCETATEPLPGGRPNQDRLARLQVAYPQIDPNLLAHYQAHYGERVWHLLQGVRCTQDLGPQFAPLCYGREVDFWFENEWALTLEDVLWRRSKWGLTFDQQAQQALKAYCARYAPQPVIDRDTW